MFAIFAALAFALALFHVHIGQVDLVTLGLFLLALQLAWGPAVDWRNRGRV